MERSSKKAEDACDLSKVEMNIDHFLGQMG